MAESLSGRAAVFYFNVTDLVWFYDARDGADPNPTPLPAVVTVDEGNGLYTIEVTLPDSSIQTVKHVGAQEPAVDPDPSPSVRWIELREREMGEL